VSADVCQATVQSQQTPSPLAVFDVCTVACIRADAIFAWRAVNDATKCLDTTAVASQAAAVKPQQFAQPHCGKAGLLSTGGGWEGEGWVMPDTCAQDAADDNHCQAESRASAILHNVRPLL
jgi:hypothetical protein